jgi:hypothetical protein
VPSAFGAEDHDSVFAGPVIHHPARSNRVST